jgi:hypothetical protein
MTTRQYTKILKSNKVISTIEINETYIKGTVTITRFKPIEQKKITKGDGDFKIIFHETVGNEVDIEFKGMIRSKYDNWYDSKTYTKTSLTRWMRKNKSLLNAVHDRTCLIGGDRNTELKKITLL